MEINGNLTCTCLDSVCSDRQYDGIQEYIFENIFLRPFDGEKERFVVDKEEGGKWGTGRK